MMKILFLFVILVAPFVIAQACFDNPRYRRSCKFWQGKGNCYNRYKTFMSINCKRTCNLCNVRLTCTDTATEKQNCRYWKSQGHCRKYSRYFTFMSNGCKKTCGFCGKKIKPTKHPKTTRRLITRKQTERATTRPVATTKGNQLNLNCGLNIESISFIVAGQRAPIGKWRWQIALFYYNDFICGGSLITEQHILTAAHCIKYRFVDGMVVRLGDHTRDKNEGREVEIEVESMKYHEEYDGKTLNNDIAILKLKKKVKLTSNIGLVCLPEENEAVEIGKSCYITGWGRMQDQGESAIILQQAKLPIVSNQKCGKRNIGSDGISKITSKMVCAGYESGSKISGCQGDSGGPLVCTSKQNKWVLQGVVSWGSPRCDADHRYTVFARTSKYISWIRKNL